MSSDDAWVNRNQLFVIRERKRAAGLRVTERSCALRVVSYPLSVIGEAGGDAVGAEPLSERLAAES